MIDMVFKKEEVRAAFEPEKTIAVTKDTKVEVGPKVLAVVDDSKKSKLMLAELKERKVNVVSEVKADITKVKAVQDVIKSDSSDYQVVYLPVTNDDYNKRVSEFTELRSTSTVPINLYFQDRSDVDIANKAFTRKIE